MNLQVMIKITGRREFDISVEGDEMPPLAAVEEALGMALRKILIHQHALSQKATIEEQKNEHLQQKARTKRG